MHHFTQVPSHSRLPRPHLRPKDSLRRQRGPAGGRSRACAAQQLEEAPEGKEDRPPASALGAQSPGRTFMNSSLSKQSVSGPLGRFILLFSIPPDAASQRQPRARGRKKTLCVPTRQPQPEPVAPAESATSANMAAAAPRPISEGSAGRPPPAAAKRDVGNRRCHSAVGHAASMRRRVALQLRQAGLAVWLPVR